MTDAQASRVLVVEDNAVFRATLELLLGAEPDLEVVGAVGDGAAAAEAARALRPDVVLLDLRLPGIAGAEAVAAIRAASPSTRILCLTAEAEPELVAAALAAGAEDVLEKGLPTRALADAVRSGPRP